MASRRLENDTRMLPNGLWRPLGRLLGHPGAPRGFPLNPPVAFWTILGRPGEGPGALWGALGGALGALGSPFGAPGGVFGGLRADLGGGRAGGLKMTRFFNVVCQIWVAFLLFFLLARCVVGALLLPCLCVVFWVVFPLAVRRCLLCAEKAGTHNIL